MGGARIMLTRLLSKFELQVATSTLSSVRVLQATLGALIFVVSFAFLLTQGSPIFPNPPDPIAVRRYYPMLCDKPLISERPVIGTGATVRSSGVRPKR